MKMEKRGHESKCEQLLKVKKVKEIDSSPEPPEKKAAPQAP